MKTKKVLLAVILIILILPLLGFSGWLLKKGKPLEVFVVNKSMTNYQGSENKAFNYVLNTEKIMAQGNRSYNLKSDHFGLIWNNGDYRIKYPRLKELARTAEKYDMVYYADACGIRTSDVRKLASDESDKLEYGGINNTDYNFIKDLLNLEKPVVIECGFLGPPTDPLVRFNLEKMIDIYYVGWMGKYVQNLAGDADLQPGFDWKELYRVYTGETWDYSGPGIVMINIEAERVFVLREGTEIETKDGLIITEDTLAEQYNISPRVNFTGWFTLMHPGNNEVISDFQLNETGLGKEKLNQFGVPGRFPALIKADENFYYMAGDFGKSSSNGLLPKVGIIGPIYNSIRKGSKSAPAFFYSYYQPFMTSIVEDALEIKQDSN
jgi:hypothetical protein